MTSENGSIDSYQIKLFNLYYDVNKNRDFADFYGYLDRTAGFLSKGLIKNKIEPINFIRPLSWLLSLSANLGISLEESFMRKYPGLCPYCEQTTCVCIRTNKLPAEKKKKYFSEDDFFMLYNTYKNRVDGHINFDKAISTIKGIFYANEVIWYHTGPWHHVAKIHEEIAEVHEAICRAKANKLPQTPESPIGSELADVLAWVLGAWGIVYPNESLDKSFLEYYANGCPVCGKERCKCEIYSNRPDGLYDFKELNKVKQILDSLKLNYLVSDRKLTDLISYFDSVLVSQNSPNAHYLINETENWISKLPLNGRSTDFISQIDELKSHLDKSL